MAVPSACNQAKPGEIAQVVLMPGDPLRAQYMAENYLENAVCFNQVRNMLGFTGEYRGKRISVMGSGMGIPSMMLYAHDLYHHFDVEAIIRIGSAGGLAGDLQLRDLVLASSAATNSGIVTPSDFPGTLAPSADFEMLTHASLAAKYREIPVRMGGVFTSDYFYDPDSEANARYRDLGLLAVDMETAGLYITAQRARKKALSILTISDHLFTGAQLTELERQESFYQMMEVSLDTAWATI